MRTNFGSRIYFTVKEVARKKCDAEAMRYHGTPCLRWQLGSAMSGVLAGRIYEVAFIIHPHDFVPLLGPLAKWARRSLARDHSVNGCVFGWAATA